MAPDRLRFDFSHPKGLRPEELDEVAQAANADVLTDATVEVIETSKAEAEALGALAFFDDKYGDRVRVVRAGAHSTEFCGGTHVDALGMIGPITVVSEGSIGSNVRRIEAVTGPASLALLDERPPHARTRRRSCSRWSPTACSTRSRRCSTASARPTRSCSACGARAPGRRGVAWPGPGRGRGGRAPPGRPAPGPAA